jgi:hypothetical protein
MKPLSTVILSEAKSPRSCTLDELRRSFLRSTQDRLRLLRMTAKGTFPEAVKASSSSVTLDPAAPFSSSIQTEASNGVMGSYAAFC